MQPRLLEPGEVLSEPIELYLYDHLGFPGPFYVVTWDNTGRFLGYDREGPGIQPVTLNLRPYEGHWRAFWSALDRIGVWGWQPDATEASDGPSWKVRIAAGDRYVHARGNIDYPRGYAQFAFAVERLVGQPFNRDYAALRA